MRVNRAQRSFDAFPNEIDNTAQLPELQDDSPKSFEETICRSSERQWPGTPSEFRNIEENEWHIRQGIEYEVIQVLANANSLSDAAPYVLQTICGTIGWEVGLIWELNIEETRLQLVEFWNVASVRVPNFEQASRNVEFEMGVGLPGRVWRSAKCAWISDIKYDTNYPRSPAAESDGLKSGFAFPILVRGVIVGVIEFYTKESTRPDDAILSSVGSAVSQICQFIERTETENRLRQFHTIIAAIGSALVQAATLRELLQDCAQALVLHLDATFARVWILDDTGKYLDLQASAGLYTHIDGNHSRIEVGQYKVGLIASERKPHLTNDVQKDPRVSNKDWARSERIVSFAGHPLLVNGKLLGVMAMFARRPLSEAVLRALGSVADQIALGVERKINEEAYRKLASIVESSDDGIISIDLDGVIQQCNEASEKMYGYCAAELINSPITLLEGSGDNLREKCEKIRRGVHLQHCETMLVRKDGTDIHVSLTLSGIKDCSGDLTGFAAITRDITQRKRSDLLLSIQYAVTDILTRAHALSDAMPTILETIASSLNWKWGSLWIVDESKQRLVCAETWCEQGQSNSEFAKVTKYMQFPFGVGMVGRVYTECRNWWDPSFSSNDYPRASVALKANLHAAVAFPIVIDNRVRAVLEFFNDSIAEPDVDLINMMSSIIPQIGQFIERKCAEQKTERAQAAEQQIAQGIIQRAPVGIARLDSNLVIVSANSQFSNLFGARGDAGNSEELQGRFIFQVLADFPTERLIETIQTRQPFCINDYSTVNNLENGDPRELPRYWDLAGWPVDTDDGGMVLMATEVTDRNRLSQQRDDFVATLTHDLKNPLIAAIRILACIIQGGTGALSDYQIKVMQSLARSNQNMLDLIFNLLEVYRYDGGKERLELESVDITALVYLVIEELLPYSQDADVELTCEFSDLDNNVIGDPVALRRVLTNLLSNGIKFTAAGGKIRVLGRKAAGAYIIEVIDTGAGISAKDQQHLFERFSQGKLGSKYRSGSGLGLYLSRQIVERHGGSISCKSEIGLGTTFSIYLPDQDNIFI